MSLWRSFKFQFFLSCSEIYVIILSQFMCVTIDRVWIDEWIYKPLIHNLELQVIAVLSLISTLHKSPQHPLSLFSACRVFISHSLATASNSGDSSASTLRFYLHSLPCKTVNSRLTPRMTAISHQPLSLLFTGWLSTANLLSHPNCLQDNPSAWTT
jgi:hypothetical protein